MSRIRPKIIEKQTNKEGRDRAAPWQPDPLAGKKKWANLQTFSGDWNPALSQNTNEQRGL